MLFYGGNTESLNWLLSICYLNIEYHFGLLLLTNENHWNYLNDFLSFSFQELEGVSPNSPINEAIPSAWSICPDVVFNHSEQPNARKSLIFNKLGEQ